MPAHIFVHLSWTTYRRMPMIGGSEARFLERFLPAKALEHDSRVLAVGIVCDHVHVVLETPVSFDISRLVQAMKGASAHAANEDLRISRTGLRWARGYDARSVSPHELEKVITYVKQQGNRHPELAIAALRPLGRAGRGAAAEPALQRRKNGKPS